MPVLARFCGVVVRMFFAPLAGAHFHAIHGDHELMVSIDPVMVIQGDAPERVRRQVLAWAVRHQFELREAWRQCAHHRRPLPIESI
jgi:hypothetical protein